MLIRRCPTASPGSGRGYDEVRYRVGGGAFTEWEDADSESGNLIDAELGQTVEAEIRSVDAVGNVSPTRSYTDVVEAGSVGDQIASPPSDDPALSPSDDPALSARAAPENPGPNTDKRQCYQGNPVSVPYPYRFTTDTGDTDRDDGFPITQDSLYKTRTYNIPDCRYAVNGTGDGSPIYKRLEGDNAGKYLPEKVTAEGVFKKLDASTTRVLQVNPALGNRRIWPIVNSLNQTFAWIEQRPPTGAYDLRNPDRAKQIIIYDSNGDRAFDPNEDRDYDGRLDVEEDRNRNGELDGSEDLNGNGQLDPGEDRNSNGALDSSEDIDRDNRLDNAEQDADGNGVPSLGTDPELARSSYGRTGPVAPDGKRQNRKARIVIQGRGCMTGSNAATHMIVSVGLAQYDEGTRALGGVRGFISDDALPSTGIAMGPVYRQGRRVQLSGMSTGAAADLFQTRCTSDALFPGTAGSAPTTPENDQLGGLNQSYRPDARYQGDSAPKRSDGNYMANYNGFPGPISAVSDRTRFETFTKYGDVPSPPAFEPARVKQVPIMTNTTSVGAGGIVRAIVPVASAYEQYDHFAYNDPNEFCAQRLNPTIEEQRRSLEHTAWKYIKVTGTPVAGWIPKNLIKDFTSSEAQRCNRLAKIP